MAVGITFIYLTPGYSTDLFGYLFGNVLMVTRSELFWIAGFNLILIVFTIIYFQAVKTIAFDEDFAIILGLPVKLINLWMMIFITVSVILLIKAVGIILVIALLTIPPSISNNFCNDIKKIIFISIFLGILFGLTGLYFSYTLDIPAGAAIIIISTMSYFLSFIIKKFIF